MSSARPRLYQRSDLEILLEGIQIGVIQELEQLSPLEIELLQREYGIEVDLIELLETLRQRDTPVR